MNILPLIVACGYQPGLWPVSRRMLPARFQAVNDRQTTFQQACHVADCLRQPSGADNLAMIACNRQHVQLVKDQARTAGCTTAGILCVPGENSSAAATALTALFEHETGRNPAILAINDTCLCDPDKLNQLIQEYLEEVESGTVVQFTPSPSRPENGFCTKEDTGIVIGLAGCLARVLRSNTNSLASACCSAFDKGEWSGDIFYPATEIDVLEGLSINDLFNSLIGVDIKYGQTFESRCTDNWNSIHAVEQGNGNMVISGDVVTVECEDTLIRSESRLVATVGVSELAILESADSVLVAGLDKAHLVGKLCSELEAQSRPELVSHNSETRPWGSFSRLYRGQGFQVKTLVVTPGSRLSLQAHRHRSEHWTVVRGSATVTVDTDTFVLKKDKSTYIPLGAMHRLANTGHDVLEIIEVQLGKYLGEDDIIRYEDDYDRPETI